MRTHRLEREQFLAHPVEQVFSFFAEARNLERLTPSWLSFQVLTPDPIEMNVGTLIDYRLRVHGLPLRWTSRIEEWVPGHAFIDRQVKGPYRLWHHRHNFEARGRGTAVHDVVDYALPLGFAGELAHPLFVRRDLARIFAFRHEAVKRLLA
ncbi:MAG: SRPBCC family protein [Solirubrobacteraceae bacterium]